MWVGCVISDCVISCSAMVWIGSIEYYRIKHGHQGFPRNLLPNGALYNSRYEMASLHTAIEIPVV